ncbi:MAG TPA: MmgE/PrpD family protein, partial [Thermoleophilaceae bacterium]|nr:MmgE/PrpD family protein [Thermoleophilaceae bacterium]
MAAVSEAPARQRAVDLLVDYLAVARRGSLTASSEVSRRAIGGDAIGPALVEGTTARASAEVAALLNGTAAHSLELDDTYEPASLHAGVTVWPAVLALSDELGTSALAAVDAGISGYDVACRLGDRLGPARAYARGFHPTGVCGVVGAAAACAELLGLDERATEEAMGIATSLAGGLLAFLDDGAWTKRLHAGRAAEGGIRAARLAAEGFSGPRDAFTGPHGFLNAFGGAGDASELPDSARGSGVLGTAVKLHPCCRYAHGCLDLLLELAPDPDEIDEVSCSVLSAGWTLVAEPIELKRRVRSPVEAQFSMPFTAALAISRRAVRLEDIERAADLSEELTPLMGRIA